MRYIITILLILLMSCSSSSKIIKSNLDDFTLVQSTLIMDSDSTSPMRVLKINNKKDSIVLRTKCMDVLADPNSVELKHFVNRLYRTVRDSISMGVGIAAPQVGVLKNIIWVQRFDKKGFPFEVYLNPKILQYTTKKQDQMEGCLSIPDRSDMVKKRAYAIVIDYDKMDGTHHSEMIEAFTAVIFQHEIDHLNGILYLDHLEQEMNDAKK